MRWWRRELRSFCRLATWSSIGTWGGEGDDEAMETASLDSESDVDPLSLFNHSSSIAKAKNFPTNRRRSEEESNRIQSSKKIQSE